MSKDSALVDIRHAGSITIRVLDFAIHKLPLGLVKTKSAHQ